MTTSRSDRRARRGTLVRTAGWLAAGTMILTAALAPASAAAANPTSMDVACNNIANGGRSPEYVWTTVDAAGVTANWATDAAHFDAPSQSTVTVRVCVLDADGADHGAIDQNTENDGTQLFPWSILGYATNPCPDSSLSFGSSVDSPAVQTKKSNLIDCPAGSTPSEAAPSDAAPSEAPPSEAIPSEAIPSEAAPSDAAPSDAAPSAADPSQGVEQPSDNAGEPSGGIDQPIESSNDEPSGEVLGAVGTPNVTPPPTDTELGARARAGGNGWRMALVLMAVVLVGALSISQPKPARRRA